MWYKHYVIKSLQKYISVKYDQVALESLSAMNYAEHEFLTNLWRVAISQLHIFTKYDCNNAQVMEWKTF